MNPTLMLYVLSLGLAVTVAAELTVDGPRLATAPEPPALTSGVKAEPTRAVDLERLAAAIRERPLFTPGRRRLAPAAVVPAEESTVHEITARLTGLMIEPGSREALFASDGRKPFAARPGDQIEGWTVTSIEADGVTLNSPFGERRLRPTGSQRPANGGPNSAEQSVANAPWPVPSSLYRPTPAGTLLRLLAQAPITPEAPPKPNTGMAPARSAHPRL